MLINSESKFILEVKSMTAIEAALKFSEAGQRLPTLLVADQSDPRWMSERRWRVTASVAKDYRLWS